MKEFQLLQILKVLSIKLLIKLILNKNDVKLVKLKIIQTYQKSIYTGLLLNFNIDLIPLPLDFYQKPCKP